MKAKEDIFKPRHRAETTENELIILICHRQSLSFSSPIIVIVITENVSSRSNSSGSLTLYVRLNYVLRPSKLVTFSDVLRAMCT